MRFGDPTRGGIWGSNSRWDSGIQREVGFGDPTRGGIGGSNANRNCRSNAHLERTICSPVVRHVSSGLCVFQCLRHVFLDVNPRIERAMGSQIENKLSAADAAAQRSKCWHDTCGLLLQCVLNEMNVDLASQPPQTCIIRSQVVLQCAISSFEAC